MGERAGAYLRRIRRELERRGSPAVARRTQRFFKEPVQSYGWRTADVRRLAGRLRREILTAGDAGVLFNVAEKLFAGPTTEEATLAVVLLEKSVRRFSERDFRRLERWLPRIDTWSDCDALCTVLLGPMIQADTRRLARVFLWAQSENRWRRRAAAVSLVPAARQGLHGREVFRLARRLLRDEDDLVQKGVGWLLREAGKAEPGPVVEFLLRVRGRAPRLVLRTACEKLPAGARRRVLARFGLT